MKNFIFIIVMLMLMTVVSIASTITYGYDRAGRLTQATYSGGQSITYHYDAAGNQTNNVVTAPADADGDGMADSWEITYFGGTSRDGTGDFDGDGQSDLAEYLSGTLPNDASSLLRISTFSTTNG